MATTPPVENPTPGVPTDVPVDPPLPAPSDPPVPAPADRR